MPMYKYGPIQLGQWFEELEYNCPSNWNLCLKHILFEVDGVWIYHPHNNHKNSRIKTFILIHPLFTLRQRIILSFSVLPSSSCPQNNCLGVLISSLFVEQRQIQLILIVFALRSAIKSIPASPWRPYSPTTVEDGIDGYQLALLLVNTPMTLSTTLK